MKDTIFLRLSENWALGYDRLQWIIMRRYPLKKGGERWNGLRFIMSYKRILLRDLGELGAEITPAAQRELDALPDSFQAWFKNFSEEEATRTQKEHSKPQEVKFRTPRPPPNDTGEAAA